MKVAKPTLVNLALLLLTTSCATHSSTRPPAASNPATARVTAPPESFFQQVAERDREAARRFYRKYTETGGLPIVAAAEVSDAALQRASEIVSHLLAGRPDILRAMVTNGTRLLVIGADQRYTDMPEYRNSRNPEYLNERVRGTGGLGVTSFGEENLLSLSLDRYDDESIAVHEFCHTIDAALGRMDAEWRPRLRQTHQAAVSRGLWKNTYAGSNPGEYWAELCQCYFDNNRVNNWNHGPIGSREQLKVYDPAGYELVRTTFRLSPQQDWRYTWIQKLPNVSPPPRRLNFDPYYTKFTSAREFPVLGRQARDAALLKANDTIRKMFAYRHDILKALIANGVRLVVLGPHETLSDLPEFRQADSAKVDLLARFVEYTPDLKLLVVGEENVLGNPNDRWAGSCQVIRELAKALYYVCGTRAVNTNWHNRGREVQQYELRLERLDVRFDERLRSTYEAALNRNLWKGTPAVQDPVEYWAQGVLAYFDAVGQESAPNDAPHPIATRQALQAYDPGLYALVQETMAYDGHLDWRHPCWHP